MRCRSGTRPRSETTPPGCATISRRCISACRKSASATGWSSTRAAAAPSATPKSSAPRGSVPTRRARVTTTRSWTRRAPSISRRWFPAPGPTDAPISTPIPAPAPCSTSPSPRPPSTPTAAWSRPRTPFATRSSAGWSAAPMAGAARSPGWRCATGADGPRCRPRMSRPWPRAAPTSSATGAPSRVRCTGCSTAAWSATIGSTPIPPAVRSRPACGCAPQGPTPSTASGLSRLAPGEPVRRLIASASPPV